MSPAELEEMERQMLPYIEGGFTRELAAHTVMLDRLFPALDLVETAARRKTNVERVARVFFGLGEELDLKWLRKHVEALKVHGKWHAMSRANLRDELFTAHNHLVERVMHNAGRKKDPVAIWLADNDAAVQPVRDMLTHMRKHSDMDYAIISVAVRALEQLVAETTP
jgi:glutamate dehydrogenase